MRDENILIDTSVWIGYFKNTNPQLNEMVDEVLTYGSIFVPKVVMAELLQGAKTEKEMSIIENFFGAFNIIDQTEDTWFNAGKLAFSMKRKGISIHLVDCYIATLAKENDCMIFSLDEHFNSIKKFLQIKLYIPDLSPGPLNPN